MSAEPDIDRITTDAARAAAVASGLMSEVYAQVDERGDQDARIECFMVLGVMNWVDEEGFKHEDIILGAETSRRYAQRGILYGAIDSLDGAVDEDD